MRAQTESAIPRKLDLPNPSASALTQAVTTSFLFILYLILALFGFLFGCAPAPDRPAARQRQMDGLVEKFDRFDHDGNGYLTRQEIQVGIHEAGTLQLTPAELDQMMTAYDVNHDRRISRHEAQLAADRGPQILHENPRR
jgi:hypothetical protein